MSARQKAPMSRGLTGCLALLVLMPLSCGGFGRLGDGLTREAPDPVTFAGWADAGPGRDHEAIAAALREVHTGLLPAEVDHVARVLVRECERADLSPQLVLAVIRVESSGYNFARSRAGALGLMQLLPPTGRAVARRIGVAWRGRETLFDAPTNVRLGIAYLRELLDRYGDVSTALAAYNWGPTRVSSLLRRGREVPKVYPGRVLSAFREAGARDT
jgi:soluble lytic murein transglycosylase